MLQELLSSGEVGLLSAFTIGFVVVIAVFLLAFFNKKINEESQQK